MKNIIALSIIAVTFSLSSVAANVPMNMKLADEAYVDDIPFNTEMIAKDVLQKQNTVQVTLQDEAYVDDIPFDTKSIAAVNR